MLQVLQELLLNPEDKTKVTLLFANVTAADIMLKAEIDKLAAEHDNFEVVYIVSRHTIRVGAAGTHRVFFAAGSHERDGVIGCSDLSC